MTSNVSFRMDATLKKDFEDICSKLGMSISTAITIFASKMTREQRIPFDVAIDPNYNKKSEKTCEEFFLDRRMQLDE